MDAILSAITSWLVSHGSRIALIVVIALIVYYIVRNMIPRAVERVMATHMRGKPEEEISKRCDTLSGVFIKTVAVIIFIGSAFSVLAELGVNIAPALAGFGIVGVAVGFGAQSFVKDVIAGLVILMENQYGVGDVVKVADVTGQVQSVDIRKTVLRDGDGAVHYVPNGEIRVSSNLTKELAKVNMSVSVGYNENIEQVMSVINRVGTTMAAEHAWKSSILTPPKALWVESLGDSGVVIRIAGDTKPTRQWDVAGELRKRLKEAFEVEGIEMPFPITKVILEQETRPQQPDGTVPPPAK